MCPGGERCISESALCDGFHDCPDQSDEDPEICSLYSHLLCTHWEPLQVSNQRAICQYQYALRQGRRQAYKSAMATHTGGKDGV